MYASSDRAGSTLTALLEMCTDQFRFSRSGSLGQVLRFSID